MSDHMIGGTEMREAFRRLADRLAQRRIVGDVCIYGGAAMILAFDARRATRDVDAIFMPHGVVVEEAREVAKEMGLPRGWLNDGVSVYVSRITDHGQLSIYDHPHLRVRSVSARHLTAMKAHAARGYAPDKEDLVVLVRHLGLTTASEVEQICAEVFPDEPLSDHGRLAVQDAVAIALAAEMDSAWPYEIVDDQAGALRAESPRHMAASLATKTTCGAWVESAGAPCVLKPRHGGHHRSRA